MNTSTATASPPTNYDCHQQLTYHIQSDQSCHSIYHRSPSHASNSSTLSSSGNLSSDNNDIEIASIGDSYYSYNVEKRSDCNSSSSSHVGIVSNLQPDHCIITASTPFFQLADIHSQNPPTTPRRRSVDSAHSAVSTTSYRPRKSLIDQRQSEKDANIILPLVTFVLSILFPPIGCVGFLMCLKSRAETPRYKWALRSLHLGSGLSFIYAFIIASVVGHYYMEKE